MNNNNQIYKGNGLNNEQPKNNNDIYGLGDLGAAPVALGAIQKDVYRGNNNGGSVMVDAFGLADISGPPSIGSKNIENIQSIQQMPMFAPLSFGSGKKLQFDVLPSLSAASRHDEDLEDLGDFEDFSEFKTSALFFIPSKVTGLNGGGLQSTPAVYNEVTSMVVNDTPFRVLCSFESVLGSFSNDIAFTTDKSNYIINGQIFIRHFGVHFKISIWKESNQSSRFEIRRTKGDTIVFNEFYDDIKPLLQKTFNIPITYNNSNSLPPIDYNFDFDFDFKEGDELDDNDNVNDNVTNEDLNNFIIDMDESDACTAYSIAMLLNAANNQTQFVKTVFNHKQFLNCIVKQALTNQDTALQRGALIMLEILCSEISCAADTLISSYNALDYVLPLLSSDCELIQKHCIRCLYQLSNAESWTLKNQKLQKFAQIYVQQCRQKWKNSHFATNDFIKQQMFENINYKLVAVN